MDKTNKKPVLSTEEICRNNLGRLGIAMNMLIAGKTMTEEQLLLVSEASEKQRNLAIKMNAASTLKGQGQKYTNYCQNANKIFKYSRLSTEEYELLLGKNKKCDLNELGIAMRSLIEGDCMTKKQLLFISKSSEKKQNMALLMNAATTLKGQEYTNYHQNVNIIFPDNNFADKQLDESSLEDDRLYNLGDVIFRLVNEELSLSQIELVANASAEEILQSIYLTVCDKLRMKYETGTFDKNIAAINNVKGLKRTRVKQ